MEKQVRVSFFGVDGGIAQLADNLAAKMRSTTENIVNNAQSAFQKLNPLGTGAPNFQSSKGEFQRTKDVFSQIEKNTRQLVEIASSIERKLGTGPGGGGGSAGSPGGAASGGMAGASYAGMGGPGGAFSTGASLLTRPNEIAMLAGALALIPAVGQGIANIVNKGITEGSNLETARNRLTATTGFGGIRTSSDIGLTLSEMGARSQMQAVLTRSGQDVGERTRRLIELERGFGLEQGMTSQFGQYTGIDRASTNSAELIRTTIGTLRNEGVIDSNDFSSLPQLLQSQNQILQMQANVLQRVDSDRALNTLSVMGRIGGAFDPTDPRSGRRFSALNSGITNPSGDYAQAFLLRSLNEVNPGASLFELREMQEQGISNPEVLRSVMSRIRNMGGSKDMQMFQMKSLFPQLSFSDTRQLFESFGEQGEGMFDPASITQEGIQGVARRAGRFTGTIDRRTAQLGDTFAEYGEAGIQRIDKMISGIEGAFTQDLPASMSEAWNEASDQMAKAFSQKIQEVKTGLWNWAVNQVYGNGR